MRNLLTAFKGLLSREGHVVDFGQLIKGVAMFAVNLAAPGAGAVAGAAAGMADAVSGAAGDRAKISFRRQAKLGGLTRPVKEGEPDFERLREAVDEILLDLRRLQCPVVLVDGLDKVQDLRAIRDLFSSNRILALPRAQVVYSGPITLMLATEWQAAGGAFKRERLTNVTVQAPDLDWVSLPQEVVEEGQRAVADVVRRRLSRLQLDEEDVFESDCLERLTQASGGLLRDLVHLVNRAIRDALRRSALRIDVRAAEAAIEEIRKEYEVTLNTRRVDELRHVRKTGEPSGAEGSLELLLGGYVLPYSNGRVWFEPHPILRDLRPGI